ncbi:hypothetical protein TrVGV298_002463 [Trichoderma virens]|nr:hypothetical protein TrVGV298_002463 [Trichoderma virens]
MRASRQNVDLGIPAPKEVYNYRVYVLALISSIGAVMFGYDLGFIGTALELESFKEDFGLVHASASEKSAFAANVVSLLQAGCILGSLAAGPLSDRYGRLITLFATAVFFNVGSAIQTGARGSEALMLVGRGIGGIGVGAASMIVPLYVAEAAPPHIRGRLVGLYEVGVSMGTMIGFWINYGLANNLPPTSTQWMSRLDGLQGKKGREACLQVLQRLRNLPDDHPYLLEEAHSIFQQLEHEEAIVEGNGFKSIVREIAKAGNRRRLGIGALMFIFMQMAGSNAINYYSPAIFRSIGLTGTNTGLFATGIYGVVRFVAIMISMLLVVDRFGRTKTLMAGSAVMAFSMWFIGAYIKIAAPPASGSTQITAGGYAAVVMIYVYAIGWCFSWAGIPWIYAAEIFPLRIRSPCISLCVAIHWIMNFVIARSVPYMITNIGYGTYFLFAAFMTIAIPWVFFSVPETKNVSLEDIDALFGMPPVDHLYYDGNDAKADEEKGGITHVEQYARSTP